MARISALGAMKSGMAMADAGGLDSKIMKTLTSHNTGKAASLVGSNKAPIKKLPTKQRTSQKTIQKTRQQTGSLGAEQVQRMASESMGFARTTNKTGAATRLGKVLDTPKPDYIPAPPKPREKRPFNDTRLGKWSAKNSPVHQALSGVPAAKDNLAPKHSFMRGPKAYDGANLGERFSSNEFIEGVKKKSNLGNEEYAAAKQLNQAGKLFNSNFGKSGGWRTLAGKIGTGAVAGGVVGGAVNTMRGEDTWQGVASGATMGGLAMGGVSALRMGTGNMTDDIVDGMKAFDRKANVSSSVRTLYQGEADRARAKKAILDQKLKKHRNE